MGKTVNVSLVSGKVFVRLPHGGGGGTGGSTGPGFVPLTAARQLPVGSQVDARGGTIQLVTASARAGKTQTGTFGGAVFGLARSIKGPQTGLTILSLLEGAFPGAPSYAKKPVLSTSAGNEGVEHQLGPLAYCSRSMPSAWVVSWVGVRGYPIRRRVRVESDLSSTGASHLGGRLGACSPGPIAWRCSGVRQSGCRDALAPTCDAVVNMV